jgi:hypothetical protein
MLTHERSPRLRCGRKLRIVLARGSARSCVELESISVASTKWYKGIAPFCEASNVTRSASVLRSHVSVVHASVRRSWEPTDLSFIAGRQGHTNRTAVLILTICLCVYLYGENVHGVGRSSGSTSALSTLRTVNSFRMEAVVLRITLATQLSHTFYLLLVLFSTNPYVAHNARELPALFLRSLRLFCVDVLVNLKNVEIKTRSQNLQAQKYRYHRCYLLPGALVHGWH